MKELGNLAVVCAKRKGMLLQIYDGAISVHIETEVGRKVVVASWDDDAAISELIHDLNFGTYAA